MVEGTLLQNYCKEGADLKFVLWAIKKKSFPHRLAYLKIIFLSIFLIMATQKEVNLSPDEQATKCLLGLQLLKHRCLCFPSLPVSSWVGAFPWPKAAPTRVLLKLKDDCIGTAPSTPTTVPASSAWEDSPYCINMVTGRLASLMNYKDLTWEPRALKRADTSHIDYQITHG